MEMTPCRPPSVLSPQIRHMYCLVYLVAQLKAIPMFFAQPATPWGTAPKGCL